MRGGVPWSDLSIIIDDVKYPSLLPLYTCQVNYSVLYTLLLTLS